MPYISVSHLNKTFVVRRRMEKGAFRHILRQKTSVPALTDVSFAIEKGELVGYIGPNGAGKSTTVKILSGILTPDRGEVSIGGRTPWLERKSHVRHIGVVFGQRTQLWWDVPVLDSYSLLKDIYRISQKEYEARLEELCSALDLSGLLHTPLRLLSLGQRMRAELCGSLLHSPQLLFLDEPTIGLDAVSKLALRSFLLKENQTHGTTVLLTTHDMSDIAALCSRVMVLGRGSLLYDGGLPSLLSRYDTKATIRACYADGRGLPSLPPGTIINREENGCFLIQYDKRETPTDLMLSLLQKAGMLSELTVLEQELDHLIAAMYREMAI
jgi:ABC-2 type transport system ATP-binding protein